MDGKMLVTFTGKGKYNLIFKRDRDGGREEWMYNFTESGLTMVKNNFKLLYHNLL